MFKAAPYFPAARRMKPEDSQCSTSPEESVRDSVKPHSFVTDPSMDFPERPDACLLVDYSSYPLDYKIDGRLYAQLSGLHSMTRTRRDRNCKSAVNSMPQGVCSTVIHRMMLHAIYNAGVSTGNERATTLSAPVLLCVFDMTAGCPSRQCQDEQFRASSVPSNIDWPA